MSASHTETESWDLMKVLNLLRDRTTYPDSMLDLFSSDLATYGWCYQRVYANGWVERINPKDMLSDDEGVKNV